MNCCRDEEPQLQVWFNPAVEAGVDFAPLGMRSMNMYIDASDTRPVTLYDKQKPMPNPLPRAMSSLGPDGSIDSTASDVLLFLRAFVSDNLVRSAVLAVPTRE